MISASDYQAIVLEMERGNFRKALALQQEIESVGPPSAQLLRLKAIIFHRLGQGDASYQAFQQSLKMAPDDVVTLVACAGLLTDAGAAQPAADMYQQALRLSPACAEASAGLAGVLLRAGDRVRALVWLEKAVTDNPDNTAWRLKLAEQFISVGRARDGVTHLKTLLKQMPDDPDLLFCLARVCCSSRMLMAL